MPTPRIFSYQDYHTYLTDWMKARKADRSSFSYQEFANRAGIRSKSYLCRVCKGTGKFGNATAIRVSEAMGLDKRETEYFLTMVNLDNSKSQPEKVRHLEKLAGIQPPQQGMRLSARHYDLFAKWYILPIWELVSWGDFDGDWSALGRQLCPPIGAREAKGVVDLLLELGLLERNGDRFVQVERRLETLDELKSEAIKEYQSATMALAQEALVRVRPEDRSIGTVTMGLDDSGWKKVLDLVQRFREDLATTALAVSKSDRIYQCNMQVFPLTKMETTS